MDRDKTLGERLRSRRKALGLSLDAVAAPFKISAQAVQQWEKDRTFPGPDRLTKLAEILGTNIDWLITGAGEATQGHSSGNINHVSQLRGRVVPRMSIADTPFTISTSTYVQTHFPCSQSSWAFSIEDRSNEPRFMPGDSVVIDPELEARPGDMVVAAIGPQRRPVFRLLRLASAFPAPRYILEPLNRTWPDEHINGPEDGEIIGVLSEHTIPRR